MWARRRIQGPWIQAIVSGERLGARGLNGDPGRP